VTWSPLPDVYGVFIYLGLRIDVPTGEANFCRALIEAFPDEQMSIEQYFRDLKSATGWLNRRFMAIAGPPPSNWISRQAHQWGAPLQTTPNGCFRHRPLHIFAVSNTLKHMRDELRQFKSEIFQGLANPTRIAIVELLREGELSAGSLIEKLRIEQANASQHLAVLRAKQIVVSRKVGNQVYYSIRDNALIEVLDILRRYFYAQLDSTVSMMREVASEQPKSRSRTHR